MVDKTIVTSNDIQIRYQKLYKFLMDFLWEYDVVEALANLEIACYKQFPDKEEMTKSLRDLHRGILSTYNELTEDDKPEFEAAYTALESAIDEYDSDNALVDIYSVVIPEEPSNDSDKPDKEVFKAGDIKKIPNEVEEVESEVEELEETKPEITNPFEEE